MKRNSTNRLEILGQAPHAKQFRGMPNYPMVALVPVLSDGPFWYVNEARIAVGLWFNKSGDTVTYAPISVPCMKMNRLMVVAEYMVPEEEAEFELHLRFRDKNGGSCGRVSEPMTHPCGYQDRFGFIIERDLLDRNGMLACALSVNLLKPRRSQSGDLKEKPEMVPVVICNAWLQVN